ncbi:MAG: hypothetical protein ACE5Q6_07345 [Dehalococcoidia bacterium]
MASEPADRQQKGYQLGQLLRSTGELDRMWARERALYAGIVEEAYQTIQAQLGAGINLPDRLLGLPAELQRLEEAQRILTQSPLSDPRVRDTIARFNNLQPSVDRTLAVFQRALQQFQEHFRSIWVRLPRLDPFWDDLLQAQGGDRAAAERVSSRIPWQPQLWCREAIKHQVRIQGKNPQEISREALTQGVILALGWQGDEAIPLLVHSQSGWLHDEAKNLSSISPYELELRLFWEWVKEEACRAAESWLVGQPYAPTVVLEEPPDEDGEMRLYRFTTVADAGSSHASQKGRPFGSSIFPNEVTFLIEVRQAVLVVERSGNKVTQERVANVLSHKGLLGPASPVRQLRYWAKEFNFSDWKDLLDRL